MSDPYRDHDGKQMRVGDKLLALRDGAAPDYTVEIWSIDADRVIARRPSERGGWIYGILECSTEWRIVERQAVA